MPLLPILVALLALAATASAVAAPAKSPTLTLKTSLGKITDDDTRPLEAEGRAPRGSELIVRFYRGRKHLVSKRPELDDGRYQARRFIDRTGGYRVVVVATTPAGRELRVEAKLRYGPKAKAPSAPEAAPKR